MTSNDIGKGTELLVARWLRDHGFPHAERTVRTGFRTANREVVDAGDIDGLPSVVVQVKSLRPATRAETSVEQWMADTEKQRQAAHADLGLLIVRRWGTTDVGRWWAFLPAGHVVGGLPTLSNPLIPVRMEMRHMVELLHIWGYGDAEVAA